MSRSVSMYGEYVAAILHIHLKLTSFSEAYSRRCSFVKTSFLAGNMVEIGGMDSARIVNLFKMITYDNILFNYLCGQLQVNWTIEP